MEDQAVSDRHKDSQLPRGALPPQSLEAEQSLLGGLLLDNQRMDQVADIVTVNDFYRKEHKLIFLAISELNQENQPADVLTVSEFLDKSGDLQAVGGMAYLGSLANNTPSAANIKAYAGIVRERSIMRSLGHAAREISDSIYTPEGRSAAELLDRASH